MYNQCIGHITQNPLFIFQKCSIFTLVRKFAYLHHLSLILSVDEGFSFCLNTHWRRKFPFKGLTSTVKIDSADKFSPWQTTWLLQVCEKMLYLPKLLLCTDGTIGYAMSGTWCQNVWHLNWWCYRTPYLPIAEVVDMCVAPCGSFPANMVGLVRWVGLLEIKIRGVEQDLIWYVGQLVLLNVLVKRCHIDPYVHSLLDGPGEGMGLPTNNGEIV